MQQTYSLQGQYITAQGIRELFKITPSSYPATIYVGNRYSYSNLTSASNFTIKYAYSYDGINWTYHTIAPGSTIYDGHFSITVNAPIYLKNLSTDGNGDYSWAWKLSNNTFVPWIGVDCNVNFSVSGKLMNLVNKEVVPIYEDCQIHAFYNCTRLIDASGLDLSDIGDQIIGANNHVFRCDQLFSGCTNLVYGPTDVYLPHLTQNVIYQASSGFFYQMFNNCTSLQSCPILHGEFVNGTGYINGAYSGMFRNCISLTSVPELPALTLAPNCYNGMFYGTNLRVTTTPGSGNTFRIPTAGTGSVLSGYEIGDCTRNMFSDLPSDGESDGYVDINTDYYLYLNS